MSADVKLETLRRKFAMPIQRLQVIGSRLDGFRRPDPQRAAEDWGRNRDDRIGQRITAGFVDSTTLALIIRFR